MSEKVKEIKELQAEAPKAPVEGQDFTTFEYADVFFECNRCGHMTVLDKGVKDGLQFVLPTTDKHEWRMVCGNCENMMRIFFRSSSNETIAEKKAEEATIAKQKEDEEKKRKVLENESKKKDKKPRSSKRSNKDNGGTDEPDSKGTGLAVVNDEDRK